MARLAIPLPGAVTPAARREFVERLRDDVEARRVSSGIDYLNAHRAVVDTLDGSMPAPAACLAALARSVDVGYGSEDMVKDLLARFPSACRSQLPLVDYLQLRLAEGVVTMSDENPEDAVRHFDFILSAGEEAAGKELLALAYFWKGRCRRYQAEYDDALDNTVRGRNLALDLGHAPTAAVMRTLESWLYFQKGKYKESLRTLQEAEAVLEETDDFITLGNIQSA